MKSILKKVAGVAITAVLALGMFSCSNGSTDDPVLPPAKVKTKTETTYNADGSLIYKSEYEYDANGNVILYKSYSNGVDLISRTVYTYTYY